MASKYFKGGAAKVAQSDDFTPANVEVDDVFNLVVADETGATVATISFTASAGTVANVTAGLTAAWNASVNAACTGITATDMTTKVRLTADTAGVPFYVTTSTTDGGGANTQTLTRAAVTANSGPADWNTALNWSDGALPVDGDTVILDGRAVNGITYGLGQTTIDLAALLHYRSMRYQVGTQYAALRLGTATSLKIGLDPGDGSSSTGAFFNVHVGTNACTAEVYASSTVGLGGLPGVVIGGAHASNSLSVLGGVIGLGLLAPGETGTWPTVKVFGGTLTVGSAVAIANPTISGGTVNWGAATISGTVTMSGGKLATSGTGAIATLTITGGAVDFGHRSSGGTDVATLNFDGGSLNMKSATAAFVCTSTNLKRCGPVSILNNSQWSRGSVGTDFTNGCALQVSVG